MKKSKIVLLLISLVLAVSIAGNIWMYNKLLAFEAEAANLSEQLSNANKKNSALQTELDDVYKPTEESVLVSEDAESTGESEPEEVSEVASLSEVAPEESSDSPEDIARMNENWEKAHSSDSTSSPSAKFKDMTADQQEKVIKSLMEALKCSREEALVAIEFSEGTTTFVCTGDIGKTGGPPASIWQ